MFRAAHTAFSLLELLIVTAIIGVLLAILLPAAGKVREAAMRLTCAANLTQQGLALHAYHDVYGVLPPAKVNPGTCWRSEGIGGLASFDFYGTGSYLIANHSGFTLLLPFLEMEDLYQRYDFNHPSCEAHQNCFGEGPSIFRSGGMPANSPNLDVVKTPVRVYACPADEKPLTDRFSTAAFDMPWWHSPECRRSNYVFCVSSGDREFFEFTPDSDFFVSTLRSLGVQIDCRPGMFGDNSRVTLADVADGLSNTIAIGETKQEHFVNTPFYSDVRDQRALFVTHWGTTHMGAVTGAMRMNICAGPLRLNYPAGLAHPGDPGIDGPGDPKFHLQDMFGFGSWHEGGANFLFGDGSVRFLRNDIALGIYEAFGTIRAQDDPAINDGTVG